MHLTAGIAITTKQLEQERDQKNKKADREEKTIQHRLQVDKTMLRQAIEATEVEKQMWEAKGLDAVVTENPFLWEGLGAHTHPGAPSLALLMSVAAMMLGGSGKCR